ncbi:hypothetical protein BFU36_08580 [Sulfolobus sp. A20]|uniref:TldD/PmbA family protein n=1 Tax=Saccharolobus sp. A20 TaxID=1891280 RepID=UPI000845CD76|nr:TldD/PmbA family protein [Sulfolobus sp. A20]TRM74197.1 TldD/PmbA family protein [Sulfolobus sp. A20-N-F8]TRM81472.1 TldD/PmbA family protein [Sulfolobus sp. D5]TRM83898.1 TldD/PmbA family protein [Sulfolobus sp. F3]TRM88098.1 TldD/PmbA family protein [Sulfolobus sp. E3]TRM98183.1 TldD/PmbA family protein [Sulfolobus sp. E1]TRN00923.1 TldD/PmbA family protein [Sulfolobus sp. F1]
MLDKILSKAKSLGYSAEIFYMRRDEYSLELERQSRSRELTEEGYGLRVFKDKKMGFAYSTVLSESLLDRAIKSWKVSEADNSNEIPRGDKVNVKIPLYYDFDKVEVCKEFIQSFNDMKVNFVNITCESYINEVGIVNTEGLDQRESRSGIVLSVFANYKDGNVVTPEIHEVKSSRRPSFEIVEEMKRDLEFKVNVSKKRSKLEDLISKRGGKLSVVIFTPKASSILIGPLLAHAVSQENAYRGKSSIKEGMEINAGLKIIDDPTIPNSIYSRSFDGEGLQSKVNVIIDNEVKMFLNNWYWSLKAGKEPTASAARSYTSIPYISPTNIKIEHREKLSEDEDYLVVDEIQGVHTSNFDTGEFSVVTSVSWFSKSNEGVRETTLTGSLVNLLRGIIAESNNVKQYRNIITGDLLISGLSVS